jgi:hypothetical protein
MDPASATIASIGLAASLTTLLGLVVDSSKTLYDLQRKLRQAPEGIVRLQQDLRSFQDLLLEIKTRVDQYEFVGLPQSFRVLWENFALHMKLDLENFKATISKYNDQLDSPVRKKGRLLVGHVLEENTIEEYRRRIFGHIGSLSLVQALINELVLLVPYHFVSWSVTDKNWGKLEA